MDNYQIPPVQPVEQPQPIPQGSGISGQNVEQPQPLSQPIPMSAGQPVGTVVSNTANTAVEPKKKLDVGNLIKTIVIVLLALTTVTFIGLFIWKQVQYDVVSEDVQGQIALAVAVAKDEQSEADEAEFAEREKYLYRSFSGPADYGQLSFEYPKTWSVYVAKDASNGGDFEAYFNPIQVDAISNDTINALRVIIRDEDFESVTQEYQRYLEDKDKPLSVTTITIGEASTTANLYTGKIPNTELSGYIVIFKIRDKTAILRTDAVQFWGDFQRVLDTITFNA